MKVLVTGINGFVGKFLSRELESRDFDVWGIDTESSSVKVKAGNILDQHFLDQAIKDISPDYLIHLAAIANVDHINSSLIYNVNFNGTMNLLTACKKLNDKPAFLYVSSSQVYGNVTVDRLPIDESFLLNPVNHYGASKASGEMLVKALGAEYGIEYVIVRPFNHTGPGQTDKFVVPKIVDAFKRGDDSLELGNIDTIRDFTDVRDIVKGYCSIIENFKDGEIYNIASGIGVSIYDIFVKLKEISGHNMNIIRKDFLIRKNDIRSIVGNCDKIKHDTGWHINIKLEDTLKDMLFN